MCKLIRSRQEDIAKVMCTNRAVPALVDATLATPVSEADIYSIWVLDACPDQRRMVLNNSKHNAVYQLPQSGIGHIKSVWSVHSCLPRHLCSRINCQPDQAISVHAAGSMIDSWD